MRPLRAARQPYSYLVAWRNVHAFFWVRRWSDSYGSTVRWRKGRYWTHVRAVFFQRNEGRPGAHGYVTARRRAQQRVLARPTVTLFEVAVWKTEGNTKDRIGTKGYVRLKAAWPGERVPE